jgi:hypothetical protein
MRQGQQIRDIAQQSRLTPALAAARNRKGIDSREMFMSRRKALEALPNLTIHACAFEERRISSAYSKLSLSWEGREGSGAVLFGG